MSVQLDERVLQGVRELYEQLGSKGELLPAEQLERYYDCFRKRFAPEKMEGLKGEGLLEMLHGRPEGGSLIYWLEFKKDEEFDTTRLGSIKGGSALKFGVYRDADTGAWMGKGPGGKPVEIPLEQAMETAIRHRDQMVRGCRLLDDLPEGADDAEYLELQAQMDAQAPVVSRLAWGHKYFSLLYPEKLDDYHSPVYQRFHLIKLLYVPPGGSGRYVTAAPYVRLANHLGVPIANLTNTLNHRHGEPHSYWKVLVNYPRYGQEWMNWANMREGGFVGIGWDALGDLSDIAHNSAGKAELGALMEEHYDGKGRWSNEIYSFVAKMSPGDVVVAFEVSEALGAGEITGAYDYEPGSQIPHRRPAEWLLADEKWKLPQKEAEGSAIRELKDPENLVSIERKIQVASMNLPKQTVDALGELVEKTNLPGGELGELEDMLRQKKQVILEGPPGSGKTYVAELFARYFTDNPLEGDADGRLEIIQFHQSYGYEDFIQGIRPITNPSGHLEYRVQDGIFKRVCALAEQDQDRDYVVIVDEINRGNISRIFGELLLLLEYRNREITLPYASPEASRFSIPPNVYLLGTMNTTDRSLAQIDYALRRRFYFYRLLPVVDGNAPVLESWLDKQPVSDTSRQQILSLFVNLNRRVQQELGEHFQVGHSYLMDPGVGDPAVQERIWRRAIMPLLEEYFYNRRNRDELLAGFGRESLLGISGHPEHEPE